MILSRGSRGLEVRWVQERLNAHGFRTDVDGIYGSETVGQVRAFQAIKGLDVDGDVGPETRAALAALPARAAPAEVPSSPLPEGVGRLSSRYGYRIHPVTKVRSLHGGVDLAAPTGTPVVACAGGRVVRVDRLHEFNGNAVFVAAAAETWCYLHLDTVSVATGSLLTRGAPIGTVGSTGRSTGPHLHLEVYRPPRVTFDPLLLFAGGLCGERAILQQGAVGAAVEELQRRLGVPVTGLFDVGTGTVVRARQKEAGVTVDGIVGPTTWKALGA